MRTTVDIPDTLGHLVKIRAAQSGQPLKVLITRALERELASEPLAAANPHRPAIPVIKSRSPGSLTLTPDQISALLVREEVAAYAAALRH